MGKQVPLVDYLVLDDGEPYLRAHECQSCGACYFDRRNACARCGSVAFDRKQLGSTGTVRAFTIVQRAAPGVPAPYVSAVIDLEDGGVVKANLLEIEPDPDHVRLGMPVRMTTFVAGTDDEGTEAVAFGFAPAGERP
jgi:uncharacterized OB-fold protein